MCPKHAIRVEDGLAVVDKRLCIGCGKCVSVCPRKLIELVVLPVLYPQGSEKHQIYATVKRIVPQGRNQPLQQRNGGRGQSEEEHHEPRRGQFRQHEERPRVHPQPNRTQKIHFILLSLDLKLNCPLPEISQNQTFSLSTLHSSLITLH